MDSLPADLLPAFLADAEPRSLAVGGALAIGLAFGALARLSGFCLRSAVSESAEARPGGKTLSYAAALLAAISGAQALHLAGAVDLGESLYLANAAALPAVALGGLLFGAGMVLARGCGARQLVLAGGGNLRAWVVVAVLGLVAYATLRGILAPLRLWLESLAPAAAAAGLPETLGLGAPAVAAVLALAAAAVAARAVLGLRGPARIGHLAAGLAIGALVPLGWWVTGALGADPFEPAMPVSLTFTAPLGDGLQYLMTYTGARADFGIAAVAGTLAGAFAVAALRRELRVESFAETGQFLRAVGGAALMGFGGVLALGCTVGAGLTGLSTLSLASLVALAAILVGARAALAFGNRRRHVRAQEVPAE